MCWPLHSGDARMSVAASPAQAARVMIMLAAVHSGCNEMRCSAMHQRCACLLQDADTALLMLPCRGILSFECDDPIPLVPGGIPCLRLQVRAWALLHCASPLPLLLARQIMQRCVLCWWSECTGATSKHSCRGCLPSWMLHLWLLWHHAACCDA
jgi:hypothetical protein